MRVLFTTLLIVLSNWAAGQRISRESYDKAVDYLNCRISELSMQNDSTFSEKCPCEKGVAYPDLLSYLKTKNAKATIALAEEINTLKSEGIKDSSSKEIVLFLSEEIFQNVQKYPRLSLFSSKRKDNADFATLLLVLKKDLGQLLLLSPPAPKAGLSENTAESSPTTPTDLQNLEDRLIALEYTTNTTQNHFKGITFEIDVIAISLTLLLCLLLFYFLTKARSMDDSIPFKIKNYVREKITESYFDYESAAGIHAEIRKLEDEVIRLRTELSKLKEQANKTENS